MYVKSIIKYMSFKDKIRMASIDMNYRKFFLSNEKPPVYFYNKAFGTEDIKGMKLLLGFHSSIYTFESTYNLLKRSLQQCKIKIIEWLLKEESKTSDKNIFKKELRKLYKRYMCGTFNMNKKVLGFIRFSSDWSNIDDIIKKDDDKRFEKVYNNDIPIKYIMDKIYECNAKKIYKWLFYNVGYKI